MWSHSMLMHGWLAGWLSSWPKWTAPTEWKQKPIIRRRWPEQQDSVAKSMIAYRTTTIWHLWICMNISALLSPEAAKIISISPSLPLHKDNNNDCVQTDVHMVLFCYCHNNDVVCHALLWLTICPRNSGHLKTFKWIETSTMGIISSGKS